MKITYLVRGWEYDFKRIGDRYETIILHRCWRVGGLLYGYKDRFNVVSIALEDIKTVEEV